jgi:alpha-mannosidase
VPVVGAAWTVTSAAGGATLPSQTVTLDNRTLELPLLYINHYGLTPAQEAAAIAANTNPATHDLYFVAELPAVGYSTFTATKSSDGGAHNPRSLSLREGGFMHQQQQQQQQVGHPQRGERAQQVEADQVVENSMFSLTFDGTTNLLKSITNKASGTTADLSVTWGWYNSSVGGCTAGSADNACSGQKSGAYIFRPNSSTVFYPGACV